ncbi:unnamed protein product [Auanema sp. JU1783]|nr:unnamed protein product [Auanema sp. JU1783]
MGRTSYTTKKTTTQSGMSAKGSSGRTSKTTGKTSKFGATGKTSSSNNGMTGVTGLSSKAGTRSRSGFTTSGGRSKFGTSFASTFGGDTTGESYKLSRGTKKNSTVVKGLLRCCRFVLLMNLILLFAVFASRTVTDIDFKVLQTETK